MDGFDQDEAEGERDEGTVFVGSLLVTEGDALDYAYMQLGVSPDVAMLLGLARRQLFHVPLAQLTGRLIGHNLVESASHDLDEFRVERSGIYTLGAARPLRPNMR